MSKLIYPYGVLRLFFSLRCNFDCGYCSMKNQRDLWRGDEFAKEEVTPDVWIKALERLEPTRGLIVTPCNAEPPIYKGCAEIVNVGLGRFPTHLYTNLSTESREEIAKMKDRSDLSFYVSYHRGQIDLDEFIENAKWLQANYNVINFHAPMYPPFKDAILEDAKKMKDKGVILDTTHEFLGEYKGKLYYSYLEGGKWIEDRIASRYGNPPAPKRTVLCKTSYKHDSFFSRSYTVAPNGNIYTCWRYLYNHSDEGIIGNFFDENFQFDDKYFECKHYGDCNICAWHRDIKDAKTGEQLDSDTNEREGRTISACMIVKDEEEMLGDCLASIEKWTDEIIVVDTGSTDKTIEIAKQHGAKIYEQKWEEDFSAHRNFSISKATMDWIFIIDADERVIPGHGENLKKMLPEIKQTDVIAIDVYNLYLSEGVRVPRSHFKSLRLFRRSSKPKYQGRIHNKPAIPMGSKVYMLPMRINHFGYDMSQEVMDKKYVRTVEMCKRWVREEPKEREAWFQLARAMKVRDGKLNTEEMPLIMDALQKGIALGSGDDDYNHIYLQTLNLRGWLEYATGKHTEAINYGKRAIAIKPDYLDSVLLVGLAYTYGVDAKKGEEWLQRYLREQEAYQYGDRLDGVVMEHANDRVLAYKTLIDIEGWKEKNQNLNKKVEGNEK